MVVQGNKNSKYQSDFSIACEWNFFATSHG